MTRRDHPDDAGLASDVARRNVSRRHRLLKLALQGTVLATALSIAAAVGYHAHLAARDPHDGHREPIRAETGKRLAPGKPPPRVTRKRYAVQGPSSKADPFVARREALREAMEFEMIGSLHTGSADAGAATR